MMPLLLFFGILPSRLADSIIGRMLLHCQERVCVCVCGCLCVCAWIWLRCLLTTINILWPLSILPLARAPFRTCGRCLSSHVTLNPQQLPAGISRKVEATLWDHHAPRFTAILVFRRRAAGISVLQPFPWILIPKTEMHFLSYFILLLFDDEAKEKKKKNRNNNLSRKHSPVGFFTL